MVDVPYTSFDELRHTLEKAVNVMKQDIEACEKNSCRHKDSSLRVRKGLYYHFLKILDDMNVMLDELPNGK